MDDQCDLREVGVGCVLVGLGPEFDRGIGLIVKEPLDPLEFPLRVLANAVRDLGVLALDDRPHAIPPAAARVGGERSEPMRRVPQPTCTEYTRAASGRPVTVPSRLRSPKRRSPLPA